MNPRGITWLPGLSVGSSLLLASGLRYVDVGFRHASPFPISAPVWGAATALCLAGMLGAAMGLRHATPDARRAIGELSLMLGAIFVFIWGAMPSDLLAPVHWLLVGLLLVALAGLFYRDRARRHEWGLGRAHFARAVGELRWPTLIMVLVPAATLPWGSHEVVGSRVLVSLLSYPVYALAQLTVFVAFLLPRLRRAGGGPATMVISAALLFALVHWPNGPLMAACFVTMLLWAKVFTRVPNVFALAVSMGIAATAFTQLLPHEWTQHLRVGPGYVLAKHLDERYAEHAAHLNALTSEQAYAAPGGDLRSFVASLYPAIFGRVGRTAEIDSVTAEHARRRRAAIASDFFLSLEQSKRRGPLSDVDEAAQVTRLASDAYLLEVGGSFESYVAALYPAILGRNGTPAEIAAWTPALVQGPRVQLVRSFLESDEFKHRAETASARVERLGPPLGRERYR